LGCKGIEGDIRRSHVSWEIAENVCKSNLQLGHLTFDLSLSERGKICVVPGMGADLVTLIYDSLDCGIIVVDNIVVIAVDEPCSVLASGLELVQNTFSVYVWTIVKGYSDFTRSCATGVYCSR